MWAACPGGVLRTTSHRQSGRRRGLTTQSSEADVARTAGTGDRRGGRTAHDTTGGRWGDCRPHRRCALACLTLVPFALYGRAAVPAACPSVLQDTQRNLVARLQSSMAWRARDEVLATGCDPCGLRPSTPGELSAVRRSRCHGHGQVGPQDACARPHTTGMALQPSLAILVFVDSAVLYLQLSALVLLFGVSAL